MDRLSRPAAAILRWCARLLPAGRAEWAEAILAEAENVPAGCQRLAWLGGGLRMVSRESMIMRKAGAICAFAVAVGCIASLSWPQSAVNRVTVANRVSLLVTVALLVGLWAAGRRLVGPACAGRAQRLVRAGGLLSGSRADAMQGVRGAHTRPRDPGARSGRPAVDRRSAVPADGGHLHGRRDHGNRAAVAGDDGNPAPRYRRGPADRRCGRSCSFRSGWFVTKRAGCCRGAPGRIGSTCLDRGARCALRWPGVLAARRFTSGQALPPAAGPASGFSARLGKAFALYGAGTDGAAESEARIRQGVAAGLVAGLTGAMLAVLLGTATIALLPHDSQLLGWLYPHLSHAATLPAEQGAGGNAAGYLILLLAVPFAASE